MTQYKFRVLSATFYGDKYRAGTLAVWANIFNGNDISGLNVTERIAFFSMIMLKMIFLRWNKEINLLVSRISLFEV